MVAGGSIVVPAIGGTDKRVRTRSHRDVFGSLWNRHAELGRESSAAEAARGVLALHGPNRIDIHCGGEVIGLVAHIAELHREV